MIRKSGQKHFVIWGKYRGTNRTKYQAAGKESYAPSFAIISFLAGYISETTYRHVAIVKLPFANRTKLQGVVLQVERIALPHVSQAMMRFFGCCGVLGCYQGTFGPH